MFEVSGYAWLLDSNTPWGYIRPMLNDTRKTVLSRLGRIEGQVRGLSRMVEGDRYCIDIVNQVQAVIAALKKVESEMLEDHVSHCLQPATDSRSMATQRKKIQELLATLSRAV